MDVPICTGPNMPIAPESGCWANDANENGVNAVRKFTNAFSLGSMPPVKNRSSKSFSANGLEKLEPSVDPKNASTAFCVGIESLLVACFQKSVNHFQNSSDCLPKCM